MNGRLNKNGVITPRFNVQYIIVIEYRINLVLPYRGFGIIIRASRPFPLS